MPNRSSILLCIESGPVFWYNFQMAKHNYKSEIEYCLSVLYVFKTGDARRLLSSLDSWPEEGLAELLKLLKEAKENQDGFLKKMNKLDPAFNQKLKRFLRSEYKVATDKATLLEQDDAESILDNL